MGEKCLTSTHSAKDYCKQHTNSSGKQPQIKRCGQQNGQGNRTENVHS